MPNANRRSAHSQPTHSLTSGPAQCLTCPMPARLTSSHARPPSEPGSGLFAKFLDPTPVLPPANPLSTDTPTADPSPISSLPMIRPPPDRLADGLARCRTNPLPDLPATDLFTAGPTPVARPAHCPPFRCMPAHYRPLNLPDNWPVKRSIHPMPICDARPITAQLARHPTANRRSAHSLTGIPAH